MYISRIAKLNAFWAESISRMCNGTQKGKIIVDKCPITTWRGYFEVNFGKCSTVNELEDE
jgi:hypothetical protein